MYFTGAGIISLPLVRPSQLHPCSQAQKMRDRASEPFLESLFPCKRFVGQALLVAFAPPLEIQGLSWRSAYRSKKPWWGKRSRISRNKFDSKYRSYFFALSPCLTSRRITSGRKVLGRGRFCLIGAKNETDACGPARSYYSVNCNA